MNEQAIIVGIDPGESGGIAWFSADGNLSAKKYAGHTEADIVELLHLNVSGLPSFAFIEQVGANRGKGDRPQGASSMFTFGRNYGFWRGVLSALRIPFEEVRPQVWLPAMGLRGRQDESQTEKKKRHKQLAQQLFPGVHITHATADAILLAEYCRRVQAGRYVTG